MLIDHDVIEIGNIVRHELGEPFVDLPKASTLAANISSDFPLCEAIGYDANFLKLTPEEQFDLVRAADVVVAATDDNNCQQAINQICLRAGVTSVYPAFWVDPRSGTRDAEVGEIFWHRPGTDMPCYSCLTSWRPEETGAATRGGNRADIHVLVLATLWVVFALLHPDDERALSLNPQRSFLLVHGFMPFRSDVVREMFRHAGDEGLLSFRVPFPSSTCQACGHRRPSPPGPSGAIMDGEGIASLRGIDAVFAQLEDARRRELAETRREWAATMRRRRADARRRLALGNGAFEAFGIISWRLGRSILQAAPTTVQKRPVTSQSSGWELSLGPAVLSLREAEGLGPLDWMPQDLRRGLEEWSSGDEPPPFDVVAWSLIAVSGLKNEQGYVERGHALWFCDAQRRGDYKWYELAFKHCATPHYHAGNPGHYSPTGLRPDQVGVRAAFGPRPTDVEVAWPFTPLVDGHLDEFVNRWAEWFAAAAEGRLQIQTTPERSIGVWRTNGL